MMGKYKNEEYGVKCYVEVLRPGDHLYYIWNKPIVFEHHGIYIGCNKIIHYFNGEIKDSTLEEFAAGCIVRKAPDLYIHGTPRRLVGRRYVPESVVDNAISKVGEKKYNLLTNNCEHFASWCRTGEYCSWQVKALGLKSFLHYVPGFNTMIMYD